MPRNGAGGYSRYTPGTPYVAGTTIDETVVNAEMDDLGNEVANSLAKDGQTVPTANLPMGGFKHTGVANGSARNHYAAIGQVQDGGMATGTVGGTADAITLTTSPAVSAYAAGQRFVFVATAANTGAATLNVSGLGAKAIKRDVSVALQAGDIANGGIVAVEYDGTNFQLLNPRTVVKQSASDNSTKPASTSYVDDAVSTASTTLSGQRVVLQHYETTYSTATQLTSPTYDMLRDGSIPQITEGLQVFSRSFTPTSSTSTIEVEAVVMCSTDAAGGMTLAIFKDSTANAVAACGTAGTNVQGVAPFVIKYSETSGSTTARTYSVRAGVAFNGQTGGVNRSAAGGEMYGSGNTISFFKITEYK